MTRTHEAYPPEFHQRLVELVKSGRTPSELAARVRACGRFDPELGWAQ